MCRGPVLPALEGLSAEHVRGQGQQSEQVEALSPAPGSPGTIRLHRTVATFRFKGRCFPPRCEARPAGGRSFRLDHERDTIVLILLDQESEPLETYEAERHDVEKAPSRPGEVFQPQLRVGVPWSLSDTLGGVWLG